MMTRTCFMLLLLPLLCAFVRQANANGGQEEIYDRVFAQEGEPLAPQKTLELLEELRKLYRTGHGSLMRRDMVKRLIEATQCNCYQEQFDEIKVLIEENKRHQLNVVPFLEHYFDKHMEICFPDWTDFSERYRKIYDPIKILNGDREDGLRELKNLVKMLNKAPNNLLHAEKKKLNLLIEIIELVGPKRAV